MQSHQLLGGAGGHRHRHRGVERQPRQRLWRDACESLAFYWDNNIPIYGSGLTVAEACAGLPGSTTATPLPSSPLAFGPSTAWVTDEEPGACYFYDHKDEIRHRERDGGRSTSWRWSCNIWRSGCLPPRPNRYRSSASCAAGADIVTGVQSHVPQAQEPYGLLDDGGPGMISYGLGNLFDQMWSWETRTELMAFSHHLCGALCSTQKFDGGVEDYAQPRWADA
ncbi:MAG: hypothetical protein R2851_13585 [Caldilineaceae bacterium]